MRALGVRGHENRQAHSSWLQRVCQPSGALGKHTPLASDSLDELLRESPPHATVGDLRRIGAPVLKKRERNPTTGDDDIGALGLHAWKSTSGFKVHRLQSTYQRPELVVRDRQAVQARTVVRDQAQRDCRKRRHRAGNADWRPSPGKHWNGSKRFAQRLCKAGELTQCRRVVSQVALGQADAAHVEAFGERQVEPIGVRPPENDLGATAADVENGSFSSTRRGEAAERSSKRKAGFLLATDDACIRGERSMYVGSDFIPSASVSHRACPDHRDSFHPQRLHRTRIFLQARPRACDGGRRESTSAVNALAQACNRRAFGDGHERTVLCLLRDEQKDGVRSNVYRCDSHQQVIQDPKQPVSRSGQRPGAQRLVCEILEVQHLLDVGLEHELDAAILLFLVSRLLLH
jgi:hypothetical protein